MPGVVRARAALAGPMRAPLAHPTRTVAGSAGLGDRVRDRVHAERACRIACERFSPERFGVDRVAVFGVYERGNGQHELEAVSIARPGGQDVVEEGAKPIVPTQKEIT